MIPYGFKYFMFFFLEKSIDIWAIYEFSQILP